MIIINRSTGHNRGSEPRGSALPAHVEASRRLGRLCCRPWRARPMGHAAAGLRRSQPWAPQHPSRLRGLGCLSTAGQPGSWLVLAAAVLHVCCVQTLAVRHQVLKSGTPPAASWVLMTLDRDYSREHLILLALTGLRAAHVACSKTSFTPSFLRAEHSRYMNESILLAML